jgi:hypothetical protein
MRDPNTTIRSEDYRTVMATEFDVLVDSNPPAGMPPVIGLMVTPVKDEKFIVPMAYEAAADIAQHILRTLSSEAPHLLLNMLQNRELDKRNDGSYGNGYI